MYQTWKKKQLGENQQMLHFDWNGFFQKTGDRIERKKKKKRN